MANSARILVVDDSKMWRTALCDAFVEQGYQVDLCDDGLSAIKKIRDSAPDAVFADLFLPRVDGLRICDFVKRNPITQKTITILISSAVQGNISRESMTTADAVIAKGPLVETIELSVQVLKEMLQTSPESRFKDQLYSVATMHPREINRKLIKLHEYMNILHHDMVDAVFEIDASRCIARINPAALNILHTREDEALGRNLQQLLQITDDHPLAQAIVAAVNTETPPSGPFEHQLGDYILQSSVSRISPTADSSGAIVVCRDLSELKKVEAKKAQLEQQLQQSRRLESLGTLAGGVAHDMNNILTSIMGLASVLRSEMRTEDPWAKDIQYILEACQRGSDLTRNLLGFARRGMVRHEDVSLNLTVKEVCSILSRTIPKRIEVQTNLQPELHPVTGDPAQLSHAIMNICLNAVESMAQAGRLTLSTKNVEITAADLSKLSELTAGPYVRLRVVDTGRGMDDNTLQHCFEPFFSTNSQATGLGLSMVYGAVTHHAGAVRISSTLQQGTTLTIWLPADTDTAVQTEQQSQTEQPSVLLVDDEKLVRNTGTRLLKALGYTVLLAHDGQHALQMYQQHQDKIALVIMDLMMPVMDGAEAFHRLRKINPQLKILLCSGYSKEDSAAELIKAGAAGFMQKPFDLQQLTTALQKIPLP